MVKKITSRQYTDGLLGLRPKLRRNPPVGASPRRVVVRVSPVGSAVSEEGRKYSWLEGKRREESEVKDSEERVRRKRLYASTEEELERCLLFQSQMGERVRPAMRDKPLLERLVVENAANNKKIAELRQRLKQLERWS